MAIRVRSQSLRYLNSLISNGDYNATAGWTFSRSSDGDKLLGDNGNDWANYARHFIADDTEETENTKGRYKYPVAKENIIYRRGLIAARQRAAAENQNNVVNALQQLQNKLDAKIAEDNGQEQTKYSFKNPKKEKKEKQVFINIINDAVAVSADSIDNSQAINDKISILQEGDEKPFYFVNAVQLGEEHPTAYGNILTEQWAESFLSALDKAPLPLSAYGHENELEAMKRRDNDGYVVGGVVRDNTLYLKNYILKGETPESQERLNRVKREIKAGMLSTSTSDYQRKVLIENNGELTWYSVESIAGQRNDIVEHDLTGADSSVVATSLKTNGGGQDMEIDGMYNHISTAMNNGAVSQEVVAQNLGLELISQEQVDQVDELQNLKKVYGEDIKEQLEAYKAGKVDMFKAEVDSVLNEKINKDELKAFAKTQLKISEGKREDIEAELAHVMETDVYKNYANALVRPATVPGNLNSESVQSVQSYSL